MKIITFEINCITTLYNVDSITYIKKFFFLIDWPGNIFEILRDKYGKLIAVTVM